MIKKDELLKLLKAAVNEEEKSIPVYMNHLQAALFWVGMEPEKAAKIKESFKYLAAASTRHKEIDKAVIEKVSGSDRDAY